MTAAVPEPRVRLFPTLLLLSAAILGCESGTAFSVDVGAPPASLGSTAEPLLLRGGVDEGRGGWVTATLGVYCGETDGVAPSWYHDDGFGCLGSARLDTEVPARVWLQPAPSEWEARTLCALTPDSRGVVSLAPVLPPPDTGDTAEPGDTSDTSDTAEPVDTADTGDTSQSAETGDTSDTSTFDTALPTVDSDGLPLEPEASWRQAEGQLTWRRDGSPCGGIAEGTVEFPG